MRPRLKDVAERAEVSIKTVSNVVNGYPHVRPDTRARVERAIAELKYRPNLNARSLRSGRTGVIALALPELDIPYFAELARHVIAAADTYSWTVLIDQTGGERDRERIVVGGIRDHMIDGLIISPLALTGRDVAGAARTPLVLLGERVHRGPADHVAIDNVAAAAAATAHLIGLGRLRLAAIGPQRSPSAGAAKLRLRGYRQAHAAVGRTVDENLIASAARWHRTDGAAAMAALLRRDQPPDAVFCFNDLLALGAIRTVIEHGLRVPEDVAVVGIDDIEDGRFSTPTLTTISPDKPRIAELAVRLLHDRLHAATSVPPRQLVADHQLLVRESTAGRGPVRSGST
jgi:DNA-binding LacI/PurR family transcriptional regulator